METSPSSVRVRIGENRKEVRGRGLSENGYRVKDCSRRDTTDMKNITISAWKHYRQPVVSVRTGENRKEVRREVIPMLKEQNDKLTCEGPHVKTNLASDD